MRVGHTEADGATPASQDALPRETVLRFISIVGLTLGVYGLLDSTAIVAAYGSPLETAWDGWVLTQLHHLGAILILSAPALLLIGCVACLRRIGWGRITLLLYAWFWLLGSAITVVARIGDLASGNLGPPRLSWQQKLMLVLGPTDLAVYGSVFALAVIFIMSPASMKRMFERRTSGFEPVFRRNVTDSEEPKI